MAAQVPNTKLANKPGRRRKKKRRTEDFSSDSSSSSEDEAPPAPAEQAAEDIAQDINIDGVDVHSDDEAPDHDEVSAEAKQRLDRIKFTLIPEEVKDTKAQDDIIKKDRAQLEQEFLGVMAMNFSEDLDELRKKPDFTDKSLVILAKTLQAGSNIFDEDALSALIS